MQIVVYTAVRPWYNAIMIKQHALDYPAFLAGYKASKNGLPLISFGFNDAHEFWYGVGYRLAKPLEDPKAKSAAWEG